MSSSSWNSVVLGAPGVAVISSGGTPSRTNPEYFNGDVSWVKSGDLNDSTVYHTDECISQKGLALSAARILPKGTVLVAMYGATVGKTAILGTLAATNQAVCSIQPNRDQFNARFLQFLLMHYRPTLLKERYGGAQPNISQTIIRALKLPQPSIAEQQKIAAVLWKLQRAIATQDKLLNATADLKASAMQRLFTHGLRGEPQKDTEIGPMPESWEPKTVASCVAPYRFDRAAQLPASSYKKRGKWPVIDQGQDEIAGYTDEESRVQRASASLIVFGDHSRTLKFIDFPFVLGADGTKPLSATKGIYPKFLFYALQHLHLPSKGYSRHYKYLAESTIAIPTDEEEQKAIASALTTFDRKLAHHRAKRAALDDLFQTLLHQLMTAQIRVADLNIDVSEVTDHLDDTDKMVGKPATATGAQLPTSKSVERTGKR